MLKNDCVLVDVKSEVDQLGRFIVQTREIHCTDFKGKRHRIGESAIAIVKFIPF